MLNRKNLIFQIAVGQFSEATLGYRGDKKTADKWVQLFSKVYFQVTPVSMFKNVPCWPSSKFVLVSIDNFSNYDNSIQIVTL